MCPLLLLLLYFFIHIVPTCLSGVLRTVECYTTIDFPRSWLPGRDNCVVHYGTWESLVHELQNLKQFHETKSQVYPGFKPIPQNLKRYCTVLGSRDCYALGMKMF